jgi:hypothetical protein
MKPAKLDEADMKTLGEILDNFTVKGERYHKQGMTLTFQ